ncbi:hypothetical protein DPMN_175584 [Dreissena polymorpha]|uniref:Uncharacterized protein n=1 Tax=Dreissena polymorpha TaxID=45954 RepID=A0A9D4E8G8_DREPO|nr:hypothetical protein DPMN_175584 [Dreissena polymorpha]
MASLEATSRGLESQNGLPITLSVLSTAVMGHFNYLLKATPSKSWPVSLPCPPSTLPLPLLMPSSADVVIPLSTYGQLPFRLTILPSSGCQRSQWERTFGSRDDGTRLIN